ncbi:MAG: hypothetical protein Q7T03_07655 [Deltaproteobacteria bacterium]|nr:hypothetical protein [Deltaproteobacteria bacterium]
MVFLKNYFVGTTQEIDFIPIIHDVRFAVHDSQIADGLATIGVPESGASLLVTTQSLEELLERKEKLKMVEGFNMSLSIPFQKKELILNPKQIIYLVDFTAQPKRREFYVQVMGEGPPQGQNEPKGGKRR